ncbi:thiazolylpeptide-type bacteriocin precursor [Streptococcus pyogenes]|uniref:thiocillin/thiostrepton family thiazolyl peptide n=1 Tax=Streptococcus pyogenes TaxID=1314 RepID=UPI0010A0FBFF|nr:4'-phosphopantetheinyl transferase superfamily protein [Streptococcus pyogenes]VGQ45865.1 thiazolylpeptide-type bacteriocin precursor [Streptococcus pyogenes]
MQLEIGCMHFLHAYGVVLLRFLLTRIYFSVRIRLSEIQRWGSKPEVKYYYISLEKEQIDIFLIPTREIGVKTPSNDDIFAIIFKNIGIDSVKMIDRLSLLLYNKIKYFSKTNCPDYTVICIADRIIGLDMEKKAIQYPISSYDMFFSVDEIKTIIASSDSKVRFTIFWTLKESLIKVFNLKLFNANKIMLSSFQSVLVLIYNIDEYLLTIIYEPNIRTRKEEEEMKKSLLNIDENIINELNLSDFELIDDNSLSEADEKAILGASCTTCACTCSCCG